MSPIQGKCFSVSTAIWHEVLRLRCFPTETTPAAVYEHHPSIYCLVPEVGGETSGYRLSLPVLWPTLLQVAFSAEINFRHHDDVCQHSDTPGLLQNAERNHKWGLSAGHPHTTTKRSFPSRTSPFSRVPRRGSCEPDPQDTKASSAPAFFRAGRCPYFSVVLHPPAW